MIDHFNVSHLGLHGHRALVVSRWMDQLFILVMHHVQLHMHSAHLPATPVLRSIVLL